MTARRYGFGDRVVVVIDGTVESFDEHLSELVVEYPTSRTEMGLAVSPIAVDSADVQVFAADDVRTEYGVRYLTDSGDYLRDVPVEDEAAQRDVIGTQAAFQAAQRAARIAVIPVTRTVTSWVESGDES